jgi:hypothetical protein
MHALRSVHSEALLKLKNMQEAFRRLDIPTNEKGEVPEGFELSKPGQLCGIVGRMRDVSCFSDLF